MGRISTLLAAVIGIPTSADRALLDTMCLASLADGNATDLELGHAREMALEMPGFRRKSREELQRDIEEALADVREHDEATMMARIAASLDDGERREQAYALAAVILYVDLEKRESEDAFLRRLGETLEIPTARAAAIVAEIEREVGAIRKGESLRPGT